jgi:hypothetical protein
MHDLALPTSVHAKTGTGNAIQSHRIPDSVFQIMRHKGGLGAVGSHLAVFPVALLDAVLTAFSDPGDLIYEPFCGSGTQLVAAVRTGRRCFAMELDRVYCDVAVRRWEMATKKVAERMASWTDDLRPAMSSIRKNCRWAWRGFCAPNWIAF